MWRHIDSSFPLALFESGTGKAVAISGMRFSPSQTTCSFVEFVYNSICRIDARYCNTGTANLFLSHTY